MLSAQSSYLWPQPGPADCLVIAGLTAVVTRKPSMELRDRETFHRASPAITPTDPAANKRWLSGTHVLSFLTQLSSADVIVPEELLPCPRGPQDSRSWCPLVRPRPDTLRLLLLHHEGPTILRPPRPGAPLRPLHCPLTTTSTAGVSCWRECPPCPAASPSPWWWPEARPQWPGRCSSPW